MQACRCSIHLERAAQPKSLQITICESARFGFNPAFFHYRPSSAARPPKKHGPASRRPRPSAESAPLSEPLYCLSTRPTSPPYPAPQLLSPPSPRRRQTHWRVTSNWPTSPCPLHGATLPLPTPHPGGAHFGPPRRTCVCARHTAAPPRCQLWNICFYTVAASRFSKLLARFSRLLVEGLS
jgi:hypothetical protein